MKTQEVDTNEVNIALWVGNAQQREVGSAHPTFNASPSSQLQAAWEESPQQLIAPALSKTCPAVLVKISIKKSPNSGGVTKILGYWGFSLLVYSQLRHKLD